MISKYTQDEFAGACEMWSGGVFVSVHLSADVNDIIKYFIAYKNLFNQILQCLFDSHLSMFIVAWTEQSEEADGGNHFFNIYCKWFIHAHHYFLFRSYVLVMLNQNNFPISCRVSSLLWWCVYWCEGGATCQSHEIHQ